MKLCEGTHPPDLNRVPPQAEQVFTIFDLTGDQGSRVSIKFLCPNCGAGLINLHNSSPSSVCLRLGERAAIDGLPRWCIITATPSRA
jgi:hypothetical protein